MVVSIFGSVGHPFACTVQETCFVNHISCTDVHCTVQEKFVFLILRWRESGQNESKLRKMQTFNEIYDFLKLAVLTVFICLCLPPIAFALLIRDEEDDQLPGVGDVTVLGAKDEISSSALAQAGPVLDGAFSPAITSSPTKYDNNLSNETSGYRSEDPEEEDGIIAGDSLAVSTRGRQDQVKAKYLTANSAAGSIAAVRQLDDLLVQLGEIIYHGYCNIVIFCCPQSEM